MARSVGARPRKAQREEAARLRAKLGECRSDQWQRAQVIFEELCAVCGVTGPSYSLMTPRACRFCHMYGHTRQYCPRKRVAEERARDREVAEASQIKNQLPQQATCSAAQWAWVVCNEAHDAVYAELRAEGWPWDETWEVEHWRRMRIRCPS